MQVQQHFPIQGANHSTRKSPIPRPWLKAKDNDDLEILGEPRWEFSISKLSSCCFGKKMGESNPPLHTPFRLIRRNSSRSYASYELDSVRILRFSSRILNLNRNRFLFFVFIEERWFGIRF